MTSIPGYSILRAITIQKLSISHFFTPKTAKKRRIIKTTNAIASKSCTVITRSCAIVEGLRDALVSRNPATTKHLI